MLYRKPLFDETRSIEKYLSWDRWTLEDKLDRQLFGFESSQPERSDRFIRALQVLFFPSEPVVHARTFPDLGIDDLPRVASYLMAMQRALCENANLCKEIEMRPFLLDNPEQLILFLTDLIVDKAESLYHRKASPMLTATLIAKIGIEQFCGCDE